MSSGAPGAGLSLVDPLWPAAIERVRRKRDPENRLLALVEQLHFPLGVLSELAANPADHVGAGTGQLPPGCIAIGQFDALFGCAGVAAISDAKEKERHEHKTRENRPRGAVTAPLEWGHLTPDRPLDQFRA